MQTITIIHGVLVLFVVGADLVIGHHHAAAHFGAHDALTQHIGLHGLAQLVHAHALLFQLGFELGAVHAAHLHHLGQFLIDLAVGGRDAQALGFLLQQDVHDHGIQHLAEDHIDLVGLLGVIGIETGTPQFRQRGLLQVEHGDDLAVDHRGNFVELGSLGRAGQAKPCHQDQKGRFFQGKFSRYAHRL